MTLAVLAIMPLELTQAVVASNGGNPTRGLMVLIVLSVIYFLPWLVAWSRQHPATDAISITNLVLGWTVLGWLGALVWAAMPVRREPVARSGVMSKR
jgi:hypothetical protein